MDALEAQRLRQEVRESIFFDQVGVPEAKRRDLKLCLNTTIPLSTATGLTTFYFLNRHWKAFPREWRLRNRLLFGIPLMLFAAGFGHRMYPYVFCDAETRTLITQASERVDAEKWEQLNIIDRMQSEGKSPKQIVAELDRISRWK